MRKIKDLWPKEVSSYMNSLPWIDTFFKGLRRSQQRTLVFFVDAVLTSHNVCLAEIARQAASLSGGRMHYALKRLWRFLHNPRMDDDAVVQGLISWVWPRLQHWKYVPISIDWTHNESRYPWTTIAASIILGRRGIPLMMWSYRKGQYDGHLSRNHCEQDFIRHLRQLLPKDDRIILIADRGFARVSLFQWLIKENIPFIIRAPRSTQERFMGSQLYGARS